MTGSQRSRSSRSHRRASRRGAALVIALCVLLGCVPAAYVRYPATDGRDVVTVRCNYMGRSEAACWADADRYCPAGYDVLRNDQRGHAGMVTLVVRCRA